MMAFTKQYAQILAGMLPAEDLSAFRFICGKGDRPMIRKEVLDNLVGLELVRHEMTIEENPREVVLLTAKGKKVAEFV
jgi:hypothetical protein